MCHDCASVLWDPYDVGLSSTFSDETSLKTVKTNISTLEKTLQVKQQPFCTFLVFKLLENYFSKSI